MRILVAGVIAFVLKLVLAASTAGTNDITTWERNLTALRTTGYAELYRSGVARHQAFIHPPAVLHGLRIAGSLQDTTGLPLRFWLRAAGALADAGTLLLLWKLFGDRVPLLVAVAPISILVSGFHGNTDPIMMFFLVAAVFFAERGSPMRAGVAFGLACGVKLVPMIFAPAILLCLSGWSSRCKWLAAAAAVWIAVSLPYLALEPALILRSLIGYGSLGGIWGFSLVSALLDAGDIYYPVAKWIALLIAGCIPFLIKRRLFAQCGLIAFSFLLFSPGFGLQYLTWAVPWTEVLERRSMIAYHSVAGIFALTVYIAAAQSTDAGFYVDLVNSLHFNVMALMGIVCWITIAVITARWIVWADQNRALPATPGDRGSIASVPDC